MQRIEEIVQPVKAEMSTFETYFKSKLGGNNFGTQLGSVVQLSCVVRVSV